MVESNLLWLSEVVPFVNQTIAEVIADKKKIQSQEDRAVVEFKQCVTVGQNFYCTQTQSYVKVTQDIDGKKFVCKILEDLKTIEIEVGQLSKFVTLKIQLGDSHAQLKVKIDDDLKTQLKAIGGIDES
jgi:hypothetical protein